MEEIAFIKAHAPNYKASKYMKQKWARLKKEIDNSTITAEFS